MVYMFSEGLLVLGDRLRAREWEGEGGREAPSQLCVSRLFLAILGGEWGRL